VINKLKTYIGFAIKAGNVVFGYDNLIVSRKKLELVLMCNTLNDKMTSKVFNFCTNKNLKVIKLDLNLGDLISRNCKVLGISNHNLSQAILNELKMDNEK